MLKNDCKIYRRKIIPEQIIDLSSRDEILFIDDNVVISEWETISYHSDFSHGRSYTFLKDGYKIGKFYDNDNNFVCWYCDIICCDIEENKLIVTDLLLDVKILPDGRVYVYDHQELATAVEEKLISKELACYALKTLDKLLEMIYSNNFPPKEIEIYDKKLL